ncbi:MAG TPA: HAMP domain-containing sensor histidine kinase, partial [Verrucomicrobiae bacterium]
QARHSLQRPRDFSPAAWQSFLADSEWRQRFPGLLEMGLAGYDGRHMVVEYADTTRTNPLFPPGKDLADDPAIKKFVDLAIDISLKVKPPALVITNAGQPRTIPFCIMPLVKAETPTATLSASRTNTEAFIYFLIDQPVYFAWVQSQLHGLPMDLRLLGPGEPEPPKTTTQHVLGLTSFAGEWRVAAAMRPVPWRSDLAPWLALLGGLGLSLFLYRLVLTQSRLHIEAEMARSETAELNRDLEKRITARTAELKLALDQAEELSHLKSNFVSMVSHEIRTPLALILGSAEMLSAYEERLSPEKRRRHLETIEEAVKRMALLVDDVLLFSRAEAGRLEFKPAALQLAGFCQRLVDEVHSATHHRCPVQWQVPAGLEPLHVDESLLRHILTNLLTNAVKYSTAGRPVILAAQYLAGQLTFTVSDQGIGIPAADLQKIFKPFFRSENAVHITGTGLGLVIVKLCVERHGGQLDISSQEQTGTTVTVRLPVCLPGQTDFFLKSKPNTHPA